MAPPKGESRLWPMAIWSKSDSNFNVELVCSVSVTSYTYTQPHHKIQCANCMYGSHSAGDSWQKHQIPNGLCVCVCGSKRQLNKMWKIKPNEVGKMEKQNERASEVHKGKGANNISVYPYICVYCMCLGQSSTSALSNCRSYVLLVRHNVTTHRFYKNV